MPLARLVTALAIRIPGIDGHSRRVARYAAGVARQMGLPRELVQRIERAAAVHDLGKLEMPAGIVNKPGRLSPEEFAIVRKHAAAGASMVARLGHWDLAPIVRHHHERLDGSGYPDRLVGEQIPFGARVVAVADVFDALTSTRPYRAAAGHPEALAVLREEAGARLDPEVVDAFCEHCSGSRGVLIRAFGR